MHDAIGVFFDRENWDIQEKDASRDRAERSEQLLVLHAYQRAQQTGSMVSSEYFKLEDACNLTYVLAACNVSPKG
jgi:hypothetical protein